MCRTTCPRKRRVKVLLRDGDVDLKPVPDSIFSQEKILCKKRETSETPVPNSECCLSCPDCWVSSDGEGSHSETKALGQQDCKKKRSSMHFEHNCKTAKFHDRHFVQHNYHDHSRDPDPVFINEVTSNSTDCCCNHLRTPKGKNRGGVATPFPLKLHQMLEKIEEDGFCSVISWQPHGRCFVVHKSKEFVEKVMPKYFRQTKLTSFQRQLNLYGFCRLTRGKDAGGYYHELFLRSKPFLCQYMARTKIKGTGTKAASSPDSEPDFYTMPFVDVKAQQYYYNTSYQRAGIEADFDPPVVQRTFNPLTVLSNCVLSKPVTPSNSSCNSMDQSTGDNSTAVDASLRTENEHQERLWNRPFYYMESVSSSSTTCCITPVEQVSCDNKSIESQSVNSSHYDDEPLIAEQDEDTEEGNSSIDFEKLFSCSATATPPPPLDCLLSNDDSIELDDMNLGCLLDKIVN